MVVVALLVCPTVKLSKNPFLFSTYFNKYWCTKNKAGRLIERTEHAELIDANKQRIGQNKELYRRRQAIVEHPYGIIKRQWGFYYITTKKSIRHASADVGLIFTAFNLRRIFNTIDLNVLKAYLSTLAILFIMGIIKFKPLYNLLYYFTIKISNLKTHAYLCRQIAYI